MVLREQRVELVEVAPHQGVKETMPPPKSDPRNQTSSQDYDRYCPEENRYPNCRSVRRFLKKNLPCSVIPRTPFSTRPWTALGLKSLSPIRKNSDFA